MFPCFHITGLSNVYMAKQIAVGTVNETHFASHLVQNGFQARGFQTLETGSLITIHFDVVDQAQNHLKGGVFRAADLYIQALANYWFLLIKARLTTQGSSMASEFSRCLFLIDSPSN